MKNKTNTVLQIIGMGLIFLFIASLLFINKKILVFSSSMYFIELGVILGTLGCLLILLGLENKFFNPKKFFVRIFGGSYVERSKKYTYKKRSGKIQLVRIANFKVKKIYSVDADGRKILSAGWL